MKGRTCPGCGAALPDAAINEALRAARCPACGKLSDVGPNGRPAISAGAGPTMLVAAPKGWDIEEGPRSLAVAWSWRTWSLLFLVPFALFWNGILAVAFVALVGSAENPLHACGFLALPHVWVGIGLAYYIVASFLNRTELRYADGTFSVRHGPVPWRGQLTLASADLEQLFVVEAKGMRRGPTFQLCALLRNGRREVILRHLPDLTQAKFLERRFEDVMGIVNVVVEGEAKS